MNICEYCGESTTNPRFCSKSCCCKYIARQRVGKPLSTEHKEKLSESHKTENLSEETRKKLSDSHKGKAPFAGHSHTEETKMKQSKSHSGFKHTEESKSKISEGNSGKIRSESTKQHLSTLAYDRYNNYVFDEDTYNNLTGYRESAIRTYGYRCCGCGDIDTTSIFQVHHIDGNHNNDDVDNLAVLCASCHAKIHPNNYRGDSTPDPEFTLLILQSRLRIDATSYLEAVYYSVV